MATAMGNGYLLDDDGAYHVITTAADDATTALSKERPRVVVKGTGINHIFTTPSAAALTRAHFVISNWSSEFVGVKNSDSTLWIRIAPAQTATVWLVTGGTAAGVWGADLSGINQQYGYYEYDDFIAGAGTFTYNKLGLLSATNGTSANASITTPAIIGNNGLGFSYLTTGTDTTGRACLSLYGASFVAGALAMAVASKSLRLVDLSTAGEEYSLDFGFGDSSTESEHTDAVCFRYKRGTSVKWLRVKATGGSVVETATDIDVAEDVNLDMRIEIASDASRADFWINRVHAGSETTALPSGTDYWGFVWKVVKSAGTTARVIAMDGMTVTASMPTRRA